MKVVDFRLFERFLELEFELKKLEQYSTSSFKSSNIANVQFAQPICVNCGAIMQKNTLTKAPELFCSICDNRVTIELVCIVDEVKVGHGWLTAKEVSGNVLRLNAEHPVIVSSHWVFDFIGRPEKINKVETRNVQILGEDVRELAKQRMAKIAEQRRAEIEQELQKLEEELGFFSSRVFEFTLIIKEEPAMLDSPDYEVRCELWWGSEVRVDASDFEKLPEWLQKKVKNTLEQVYQYPVRVTTF